MKIPEENLLEPTDPIQGPSDEEIERSRAFRQEIEPTYLEAFRTNFSGFKNQDSASATNLLLSPFKKSGKLVDPETANFLYPTDIPWTEPVDEEYANQASLAAEERNNRAFALENAQGWGHTIAGFAGGTLGSMVGDPVGTLGAIAIGGLAGGAARLLQGGVAGARAARIAQGVSAFMSAARTSPWRAAVVGGLSEASEELLLSPFVSRSAQQMGQSYTDTDLGLDILGGLLAGGILGGGASALNLAYTTKFRKLSPKAGGNIAAEAALEVQQGLRPNVEHKVAARVKDIHTLRPYQVAVPFEPEANYSGKTLYHGSFSLGGKISLAEQALIDFNFGDGVHLSADSNRVFNATAGQIDLTEGQIVTVKLGDVNLLNADLPVGKDVADELAVALGTKLDQERANQIATDLETNPLKRLYDLPEVDSDPELKNTINQTLAGKGFDGLSYSGDGDNVHNGAFIFDPEKLEVLDSKAAKIEQGPMMDAAGAAVAQNNTEYRSLLESAEREADQLEFDPDVQQRVNDLPEAPIEDAAFEEMDAQTVVDLVEEFQSQEKLEAAVEEETENAPVMFSRMERVIDSKMGNTATVEQVRGMLNPLSKEEREWLGVDAFLEGKEKVSKKELLEHIRGNMIEVTDITLRESADKDSAAVYGEYTLPGGENYREVLFTLPEPKEGPVMGSPHFAQDNVLAHVRLKDRVDADGKKVLFIEELQSDWHQEGRKKGYGDQKAALIAERKALGESQADVARYNQITEELGRLSSAVPNAPLKKTWHEYVLKRVIRMAAEGGYDKIAWTTGDQQTQRYVLGGPGEEGMRGFYDDILPQFLNKFGKKYETSVKTTTLDLGIKERRVYTGPQVPIEQIDALLETHRMEGILDETGIRLAQVADRISDGMDTALAVEQFGTPEVARLLGGTLEVMEIGNQIETVHSMDITPDLKKTALKQGFELFSGDSVNAERLNLERKAIIKEVNEMTPEKAGETARAFIFCERSRNRNT